MGSVVFSTTSHRKYAPAVNTFDHFIYTLAEGDTLEQEPSETQFFGCDANRYFTSVCQKGDQGKRPIRCNRCQGCYDSWHSRKIAEISLRLSEAVLPREVILWTAGTNWDYSPSSYEKIKRCFQLFLKRLRKVMDHTVYLRAFEIGSKGGKLHVHRDRDWETRLLIVLD